MVRLVPVRNPRRAGPSTEGSRKARVAGLHGTRVGVPSPGETGRLEKWGSRPIECVRRPIPPLLQGLDPLEVQGSLEVLGEGVAAVGVGLGLHQPGQLPDPSEAAPGRDGEGLASRLMREAGHPGQGSRGDRRLHRLALGAGDVPGHGDLVIEADVAGAATRRPSPGQVCFWAFETTWTIDEFSRITVVRKFDRACSLTTSIRRREFRVVAEDRAGEPARAERLDRAPDQLEAAPEVQHRLLALQGRHPFGPAQEGADLHQHDPRDPHLLQVLPVLPDPDRGQVHAEVVVIARR